jgi:hypothetical protein
LSAIDIPPSVRYIGAYAFKNNKLSHVTIPDGVKVGEYAFIGNPLKTITVGRNAVITEWSLGESFYRCYVSLNRRPGAYVMSGGKWSLSVNTGG